MASKLIAKADGPFLTSGTFNAILSTVGGTCYQHAVNTGTNTTTTSYVTYAAQQDGPNGEVTDGILMYLQQSAGSPGGTFSVKLIENGGTDPVREVTVNVADLPANGSPAYVFLKFSSNYTTVDAFTHNVAVKSSVNAAVIVGRDASTLNYWHFFFRMASTAAVPTSGDTVYIVGELTGAGTGTDRYVTPGVETGITVNVGQRGFHSAPPVAPTVTSCSPTGGPAAGGTSVTITGTDFSGVTAVTFGGTAATGISTVNSTTVTCTAPAHALGAVNVVVTNGDAQTGTGTNAYTYAAAPTVTSVSANTGTALGGTSVTITGTGFAAASGVTFGGTAATGVSTVNSTTITCTTPAHAVGAVNVVVTNGDTQTGTGTSVFTYLPALTVTGGSGGGAYAAGTVVTILAGNPTAGNCFASWTSSTADLPDAPLNASTTFTMPATSVTLTANYATAYVPADNIPPRAFGFGLKLPF